LHCNRVLGEVRRRINPKSNTTIPSRMHPHKAFAQLIAEACLDVPPLFDVAATAAAARYA
jgi:hypothetical protein